jgi:TRAP-type C4-dicarboxylate transport system permease small subunit
MSDSSHPGPDSLIDRIGDGLAGLCLAIAAISLLCVVAINGANVVARYLFGSPFSWAEELMLFLMILSVFAGAIAVTWRNLHIRIDTFIDRAAPAVRRAAQVVGTLVAVAAIVTVTVASTRIVMLLHSFDQRSDALQAPSWIPQSFVAIGLGTIALLMAVKLLLSLTRPLPAKPSVIEDAR